MIEQNESIWNLLQKMRYLSHPSFSEPLRGLTDEEIDKVLQGFAFHIPTDVRLLYKWCNFQGEENSSDPWLFTIGYILPLAQSVELYTMYVEIFMKAQDYLKGDPTVYVERWADPYLIQPSLQHPPIWDQRWLPILSDGGGGDYVVVCDIVEQPVAPLYMRTASGGEFYLAFDSVTSLFATIVEAVETGAYYRHEAGHLVEDRTKLAPILNRHNPRRRTWFFHATRANSLAEVVFHLDHPDEDVRYYAYLAMEYMYEPDAVSLLLQQLDHPKAEVRVKVVNLLSILDDKQAVMPLISLLADPEPAVQLATVNALIHLRDKRAVTPLFAILHHSNDKIREQVIYGLGEFRIQAAIPELLAILVTDKPMTRSEAARTLGKLGDRQVVPALINALQDDHPQVRRSAIWALSEFGGEQVIEALARLLTAPVASPQANIRRDAQAAIDKIKANLL